MVNRKGQYYGKRTIRSSRGRKLRQRAPYTITKSGGREYLTDVEPPLTNKSQCDIVGGGTFKRAYNCNQINSPVVVKNTKGIEITINREFVLYRPSNYIINMAMTDPYKARNIFQTSITNISNVNMYDDAVKSFFLKPIDSIKYVENNVEYITLLVPNLIPLSNTPENADKLINMTEYFLNALVTLFLKDYNENTLRDIVYKYLPTDIKPENFLVSPSTGSIVFSDLEFLPSGILFSASAMTYTPAFVSQTPDLTFDIYNWYYRTAYNVTIDMFNGINILRMFAISIINSVLNISGYPFIAEISRSQTTVARQLADSVDKIYQTNRFSNILKYVDILEKMISGCMDVERNPTTDKLYYDRMIASPYLLGGEYVENFSRRRIEAIDNICINAKQENGVFTESDMANTVIGVTDSIGTGVNIGDREELDDKNFFTYIIYIEQDPSTGLWATKMERTRVRAFDIGSKYAHVVLNKIVPNGRKWYYVASGEIYRRGGPVNGYTWFNLVSGMFYESGAKVDIVNLMNSFLGNITNSDNSKVFKKLYIGIYQMSVNGSYDFASIFKIILQSYFTNIKNYPNVNYATYPFRNYDPVPLKSRIDPMCYVPGFNYVRYNSYTDCLIKKDGLDLCSSDILNKEKIDIEENERQADIKYIIDITGVSEQEAMMALNAGRGIAEALELLGVS